MKRLQRYILVDTFKAFLVAFVALTLIMTVGFCMQLLHEGLDVVRLASLLQPVLVYCVTMVLPSAFLTAVIITYGRIAADNEWIAIRAAGIQPFRLIHPVLLAAVLLAVLGAYFQFYTIPRSRSRIRELKFAAFKQILLDNVALSGRRQLSFKPYVIQYDDFRDGRMVNMKLYEIWNQRPRMVVRAASAVIRTDPARPQVVVFDMTDCVVTQFSLQSAEGRGDPKKLKAEAGEVPMSVGPASEGLSTSDKYMLPGALLQRLRQLRQSVSSHPTASRPDRVVQQEQGRKRELDVAMREIDTNLDSQRNKYERFVISEPARRQQIIERNTAQIKESADRVASLQQHLDESLRQLNEASSSPEGTVDWQRQADLRKAIKNIQTELETRQKEKAALQAGVDVAKREIADLKKRGAEVEQDIAVLSAERARLSQRSGAISNVLSTAQDQKAYREMLIRIHKRLAQAASVLIFALVGIPLGVMGGRKSVMVAFGISFAIVLFISYPLLVFGQIAAEAGLLPVVPAVWAGNILTAAIGLVLMAIVVRR